MKLLRFFIAVVIIGIAKTSLAQSVPAIFIHFNDNKVITVGRDEIQSIEYVYENGTAYQVITTPDITVRNLVADIDSIAFTLPQKRFFEMSEDILNGWDAGILQGNKYLVVKQTDDGHYDVMVNNFNETDNIGICFRLDSNLNPESVMTQNKFYNVNTSSDSFILYRINDEGLYEEEVIARTSSSTSVSKEAVSRSITAQGLWEICGGLVEVTDNLLMSKSLANDLHGFDCESFFKDAAFAAAQYQAGKLIVSKFGEIKGAKINMWITVAFLAYDMCREIFFEQQRKHLYQDCDVQISKITPTSTGVNITVQVSNISSLKNYLYTTYDRTDNENTCNLVSCGLIGRWIYDEVRLDDGAVGFMYDDMASEIVLNGDISFDNDTEFTFHLPGLDLHKNHLTYYFRPYLASTRLKNVLGEMELKSVKYGNTVPYQCFPGEITKISQKSSYYCYYNNTEQRAVDFNLSVLATFNYEYFDDFKEWGIYYEDDNGSFPVKVFTKSEWDPQVTTHVFNLDVKIMESNFDTDLHELNGRVLTKKLKMGIYAITELPTGKQTFYYSEPTYFELIHREVPGVTFTKAAITDTYQDDGLVNVISITINVTGADAISSLKPILYLQGFEQYIDVNIPFSKDGEITFTMESDDGGDGYGYGLGIDAKLKDGTVNPSPNMIWLSGTAASAKVEIVDNPHYNITK